MLLQTLDHSLTAFKITTFDETTFNIFQPLTERHKSFSRTPQSTASFNNEFRLLRIAFVSSVRTVQNSEEHMYFRRTYIYASAFNFD